MNVEQAVASLDAALAEEYPGEFLDPEALRLVLDEVKRLRAIEADVRVAMTAPLSECIRAGERLRERFS